MRLVGVLFLLSLTSSFVLANGAKPAGTKTEVATAKFPLRLVRLLPETRQALLFDRNRGTYVLANIGGTIDGYLVVGIDDDEVTLAASGGTQIVLAAPEPAKQRTGDASDDRPAAQKKSSEPSPKTTQPQPKPTNPQAKSTNPQPESTNPQPTEPQPKSTESQNESTEPQPEDPYREPDVRSVEAPNAGYGLEAGGGDVRVVEAPTKSSPSPTNPSPNPSPSPSSPVESPVAAPITSPTAGTANSTPPTLTSIASTSTAGTANSTIAPTPTSIASTSTASAPAAPTTSASTPSTSTTSAPAAPTTSASTPSTSTVPAFASNATTPNLSWPTSTPTDDSVVIPRTELDTALGDFTSLMASIRAAFTPVGVRVVAVGDGSLFAKAGLHGGDIITAVDGRALRTIDDAADLYARAHSAHNVALKVTRAGKPMTLRMTIR